MLPVDWTKKTLQEQKQTYCQDAIYSRQSFKIKADETDKMKLGSIMMSDLPVWGSIVAL